MTDAAQKTLALIDASGYLYRAFHAIRTLSGPGGRPTNAVYGFTNMVKKLLATRKPDAVAVCFDRHERTFRHELDAGYKAQRQAMPEDLVPQIEDAKKLCALLGLTALEVPGFEADDLIAALARKAPDAGFKVEVASSDKDLFQLVEDGRVAVWHPVKEMLLDAKGVAEEFGVPPNRVLDVLALMGDSSDNIPGVKGIGEKSARELVLAYGSLEDIYANLDQLKGKRKELLEAGKESAFLSRKLASLAEDAPVGDVASENLIAERFGVRKLEPADVKQLAAFYDELGFAKLKGDLLREHFADAGVVETPPSGSSPEIPAARFMASPGEVLALAKAADRVALHIECAPGKPFPAEPLVAVVGLPGETVAFALDTPAGRAVLADLFASGIPLIAHDAKRLFLAANVLGLAPPARFYDVMLAAYMVSPGLHAHDLVGDARSVLNRPPDTIPALKDAFGSSGAESAAAFESDAALRYLAPRAAVPLELHAALAAKVAGSPALQKVLDEIEAPLVPVLARMETAGVMVDRGVLATMSHDFGKTLASLEGEIHAAAGEPFNVGSPSQLGRILFEKLGYPVLRKTAKTKSYATDSDVLEELAAQGTGPLPKLVLSWRELSKLKGTYVDALPVHIAKDGRIHTRYDQAVAATGRLSSNDPNLQNIPIRTEAGRAIRKAFVAPPGRVLVAADYSQIELRLLAHLSGDQALVDVFRNGEDIHRATAAKIFGVHPDLVSPDMRRGAKTINFGILYGMGPFALAGQLGVPQKEAKSFIAAYFAQFPSIRACLDGILEKARETGGTETLFGRRRPIPGLHERNFAIRSNAERMAMNAPFQGTAADLIKKAMIDLDAALLAEGTSARLLLQVHDELILECDEGDAERIGKLAKRTMEGAATLSVPLTVDVGSGRTWGEAKGG